MSQKGELPDEDRRQPRRGWLLVAVLAGVLGVANVIGVIALLITARWKEALFGILSVVAAYWFTVGAWRRTPWADQERSLPARPTLSARQARMFVATAAACVVVTAIAFTLQALVLAR